MSNDDQPGVDHMSLSRFIFECKANFVDDADNIQSGTHEGCAYGRPMVLITIGEADLVSDREGDGVVKTVAAVD